MAKARISTAWEDSRGVAARDSRALTAIGLALLVLPWTLVGTMAPDMWVGMPPAAGAASFLTLFALILGLLGRIAIARVMLARGGTVGEILQASARGLPWAAVAFTLVFLPLILAATPFLPQILENRENPPQGALLAITAIAIVGFAIGLRMLVLAIPIAAAEGPRPIRLILRGWALTRGHWWKLAGLFLLIFLAATVATRALVYIVGSLLILALGPIESWSASALVLSLILSVADAIFSAFLVLMMTSIYRQLSEQEQLEPSVPSSKE